MADQQYEVGVRLKGDGSGLVGETKAGTDAMRQLEDQAKRTSTALQESARAQSGMRTEGTAVKQVLDAQRDAAGALTREMGGLTTGTLAASTAAAGLRGVMSGVLSVIGGPAGIIALLATAALGWVSFGSSATQAAEDVEKAAQKSAQAIQRMSAVERMQAQIAELYAEASSTRERMTSREMAARATRAAGIIVPVDRANAVDAARLSELSQQLSALQETLGKWLSPEWQPKEAGGQRREARTQSQWADQDLARAAGAARAELQALGAEIKSIEGGAQTFSDALNRPLVEAAENAVRYGDGLIYTWDELGNRVVMTRQEFEKLNNTLAKAPVDKQAEAAQRELQRLTDNLERSLTDATVNGLIEGFRRGENALQNFINRMQEAFLAAVFTPIIQPIMAPIAGAMTGIGQGIASSIWGGGASFGGSAASSGLGSLLGGGQTLADFGNYFGNIGAITESGATYGFMDALGGFAQANPWVPYAGAGLMLMQGNVQGAALSAGGALIGNMIMPGLGGVIGGAAGGFLGGMLGGDGDAQRTGRFVQPFGEARAWPTVDERWFSGSEMGGSLASFGSSVAAQEQNLMRNLNLSPEQIASVQGALQSQAFGRTYGFGMEHTDWTQSGAPQQILADRLQAISSALGRSIEELTQIMSMSAEQWQKLIAAMEEQVRQAETALGEYVRMLPDRLGITGLMGFRSSLAVSDALSPMDRLAGARGAYDDTLARAMGGDLSAVQSFQGTAQQLLGVGRDVYASGPEFAALYSEVTGELDQLIDMQEALRLDIVKDLPATVMQASVDQVAAIKQQTTTLAAQLEALTREVKNLQPAT